MFEITYSLATSRCGLAASVFLSLLEIQAPGSDPDFTESRDTVKQYLPVIHMQVHN